MDKCPMCGFAEPSTNKPMTSEMNKYVEKNTGKPFGVLNSSDDEISFNGITYVKANLYKPVKITTSTPPVNVSEVKKETPVVTATPPTNVTPAISPTRQPQPLVTADSLYTKPQQP